MRQTSKNNYIPPPTTKTWLEPYLFPKASNPYLFNTELNAEWVHPMSYAGETFAHRARAGEKCTFYKSASQPHAVGRLVISSCYEDVGWDSCVSSCRGYL